MDRSRCKWRGRRAARRWAHPPSRDRPPGRPQDPVFSGAPPGSLAVLGKEGVKGPVAFVNSSEADPPPRRPQRVGLVAAQQARVHGGAEVTAQLPVLLADAADGALDGLGDALA